MPCVRTLTVTADDFGLAAEVNEAVEIAHRTGILTAASLMVAEPWATDAVARARQMPRLRVGLHLTLVEGRAVLPARDIPDLIASGGRLRTDLARYGAEIFFLPPRQTAGGGRDRGPVRGLPGDRPRPRSRQLAQAFPPSPDHRPPRPRDWAAIRHAQAARAGRTRGGLAVGRAGRARARGPARGPLRAQASAAGSSGRARRRRPGLRSRLVRCDERGPGGRASVRPPDWFHGDLSPPGVAGRVRRRRGGLLPTTRSSPRSSRRGWRPRLPRPLRCQGRAPRAMNVGGRGERSRFNRSHQRRPCSPSC